MCINNIIYNVAKCNLGKVKHRTCWPVASLSNHMQGSDLCAFAASLKNFTALLLDNLFCSHCLPMHSFKPFCPPPPPSPPSLWMCVGKYLWNSPLRFSMWQCIYSKCLSQGFHGYILRSPVAHSVCRGMAPSPHPSLIILAMGLNVNKS